MSKYLEDKGINIKDIIEYRITGLYYNSTKRFKPIVTNSLDYALQINLWKGTVWAITTKGWKVIKRI